MSASWPSRFVQVTPFAPVPKLQPRTLATISAVYCSTSVAIEPSGGGAGGNVTPRSAASTAFEGGTPPTGASCTNSTTSGSSEAPRSTELNRLRFAADGMEVAASQKGGAWSTGRNGPEKQSPVGSSIAQSPFLSRIRPAASRWYERRCPSE